MKKIYLVIREFGMAEDDENTEYKAYSKLEDALGFMRSKYAEYEGEKKRKEKNSHHIGCDTDFRAVWKSDKLGYHYESYHLVDVDCD